MQIGKLSEPALKRSVLRQLHMETSEYGADCTVLETSGDTVWLGTVANTVPGFEHDPGKLVLAAANNLAAAGASPESFLVSAVLPPDYEEPQLRSDMQKLRAMAGQVVSDGKSESDKPEAGKKNAVLGGHTQISSAVHHPLYSVTGIGRAQAETCRVSELLKPGDDLVVTGWIALGGTAALAAGWEQELLARYPFSLIDRAKEFESLMAVGEAARAITRFGRAAVHDLSQGGIFNALWEMADRAGVGLEADLKKIPVRQETIEICEYFDINPYYLYSAGALLVGTKQGEALVSALAAQQIPAAVIGRVTDGNDRVIQNGEEQRFLDRPKPDEWYRRMSNTIK